MNRSFYPGELNSNVLVALHTSIAQIAAQQRRLIDNAAQAYALAHPVTAPSPETDDYFESAKTKMIGCTNSTELTDLVDRLTEHLDRTYGEVIENAVLNGADGYRVSHIERDRDEEKLKIVTFACTIAKRNADESRIEEQNASNNLAQFNADPIAYLSKSTNSEDRKFAQVLLADTNIIQQMTKNH